MEVEYYPADNIHVIYVEISDGVRRVKLDYIPEEFNRLELLDKEMV